VAKAAKSKGQRPAAFDMPHARAGRDTLKDWRWVVDNRMRDYGDIDYDRRVIRINRELHRRDGELLIDTLFHEELHRLFPYLGERTITAMTWILLPTLTTRYRAWLYSRIRDSRSGRPRRRKAARGAA
jgi:hypothetical protein